MIVKEKENTYLNRGMTGFGGRMDECVCVSVCVYFKIEFLCIALADLELAL